MLRAIAQNFNTYGQIPPGPFAFVGSKEINISRTSSSLKTQDDKTKSRMLP